MARFVFIVADVKGMVSSFVRIFLEYENYYFTGSKCSSEGAVFFYPSPKLFSCMFRNCHIAAYVSGILYSYLFHYFKFHYPFYSDSDGGKSTERRDRLYSLFGTK